MVSTRTCSYKVWQITGLIRQSFHDCMVSRGIIESMVRWHAVNLFDLINIVVQVTQSLFVKFPPFSPPILARSVQLK